MVSLADLSELRGVAEEGGRLRIGALTTPVDLASSEAVRASRPELLDAVGVFGTPQVRHRATVGGSLCTAASCGDLAPLLLALEAEVLLTGPGGSRRLSLGEFFGDHRRTHLEPGELLAQVHVPVKAPGEGVAYQAFGLRAANFITAAGVAASLRVTGGSCSRARVALGAVAPTPFLAPGVQEALEGGPLEDARLKKASRVARDAALPISDVRGSAEHRRELVEVLTFRALEVARGRAT
jgi:carbon-monoxide dehydrogenase medium subunit